MTTTLLALEQLFSEAIGDWLEFDTTTNVGAGVTVVSTTLLNYDGGQDDYFNGWWLYITEGNNSTVLRQVSDYATATGTLTVRGANLEAEAGAVTCRLHRFNRDNKVDALNRAIEQIYPQLYKRIDNQELITGSILPDGHFEDWSSSSALRFYSTSNVTLARTTTAGCTRGVTYSAKATASADNGYFYISSDTYPWLLDLMNHSVNFYCWALPEVANDAAIVIYTKQADGTAQTLTSSTACPAGEFTLLSLENQALNDDLVEVQIRFKVVTNAKYVYFDDAIVNGMHLDEYLVPVNLRSGHISRVHLQTGGNYAVPTTNSSLVCYDIHPTSWGGREEFKIIDDSTYTYLQLIDSPESYYRMRLIGYAPLETLSADTDTISLSGESLNLICAKAASVLYKLEGGPVSSEDKIRYFGEIAYWEDEVRKLTPRLMMQLPSGTRRTG